MGERKVLNKYYPQDFDPSKIPRRRRPKQTTVRNMLPMSIRCHTCGTYIYKGTKFNMRKEDVAGEAYLGKVPVFRFYFKCTTCSAEITFKTDPRNSDYELESPAATRNSEPWREEAAAAGREKRKRDAEEAGDAMKALENRAMDSKQGMDVLAALEETRSLNSRHARVTAEQMLEFLRRREKEEQETVAGSDGEDEELIKSITFRNSEAYVKRIEDDEDDGDRNDEQCLQVTQGRPSSISKIDGSCRSVVNKEGNKGPATKMPKFIVKPRSSTAPCPQKKQQMIVAQEEGEAVEKANVLQSLCQIYDNDESDD